MSTREAVGVREPFVYMSRKRLLLGDVPVASPVPICKVKFIVPTLRGDCEDSVEI